MELLFKFVSIELNALSYSVNCSFMVTSHILAHKMHK